MLAEKGEPDMAAAKHLLDAFLDKAKDHNRGDAPTKILWSNTYTVGGANILVRTASDLGRRYFFGLNYINAEEIYNLTNSFVAFICGAMDKIILMPTDILMKSLPNISHDRNGEYKINFSRDFRLILQGRGNSLDCKMFLNNWDLITNLLDQKAADFMPDETFHSIVQGRLIEIGNIRGFQTYCPNKSKTFNRKKLAELARVDQCPELQFADFSSLRNIDVIWFRSLNVGFYPEYAFEIELSTGVWSGFGRLATLREYNTRLYIVSNDDKKFEQVSHSFPDIRSRYNFIIPDRVGLLYSAEINLIQMREEFNL
jgi:hypothetical protein